MLNLSASSHIIKIIAIARVKNEGDIIEAFVRHHAHYFDKLLILDDGSTDNTYEILVSLQSERLPVVLLREPSIGYDQSRYMTRLLEIAVERFGADWVAPLDADEFVEPPCGLTLHDLLTDRPPTILDAGWRNFVWTSDVTHSHTRNPVERLTIRLPQRSDHRKVLLIPAALVRGRAVRLWEGNHGLTLDGRIQEPVVLDEVSLCHFPIRSLAQYASKIALGYLQYAALPGRDPEHGFHYRAPFRLLVTGVERFAADMEMQSRRYSARPELELPDEGAHAPLRYMGGPLTVAPKTTHPLSNVLLYAEASAARSLDLVDQGRQAREAELRAAQAAAKLKDERDRIHLRLEEQTIELERAHTKAENLKLVLSAARAEAEALRAEAITQKAARSALSEVARTLEATLCRERGRAKAESRALVRERDDLARDLARVRVESAARDEGHARRLRLLRRRAETAKAIEAARATRRLSEFAPHGGSRGSARPGLRVWSKPSRRLLAGARAALVESRLFCPDWYRSTCADAVQLDDVAALDHFLSEGLTRGADPHPLFSTAWLLDQPGGDGIHSPVVAYILGPSRGRPHPLFDPGFYLDRNADVAASGMRAFDHYIRFGAAEGRQPHPLFDPIWYAEQRGQRPGGGNPLVDYVVSTDAFSVSPHPLFDPAHYRAQFPDGARPDINPLVHYLRWGERASFSPHALFEPAFYLGRYPQVAEFEGGPLTHFVTRGGEERFSPHPSFDAAFYAQTHGCGAGNPLVHYLLEGRRLGRLPSPDFPQRDIERVFAAATDRDAISLMMTAPL